MAVPEGIKRAVPTAPKKKMRKSKKRHGGGETEPLGVTEGGGKVRSAKGRARAGLTKKKPPTAIKKSTRAVPKRGRKVPKF